MNTSWYKAPHSNMWIRGLFAPISSVFLSGCGIHGDEILKEYSTSSKRLRNTPPPAIVASIPLTSHVLDYETPPHDPGESKPGRLASLSLDTLVFQPMSSYVPGQRRSRNGWMSGCCWTGAFNMHVRCRSLAFVRNHASLRMRSVLRVSRTFISLTRFIDHLVHRISTPSPFSPPPPPHVQFRDFHSHIYLPFPSSSRRTR